MVNMLFHYLKEVIKDPVFIKRTLMIAVPLMLQQLIVSSVNLVDNLMVGQLGDLSLSAVSSANRFYFIAQTGINGLVAACTIFLAQYHGAENEEKMRESYRFSLVSSYLLCSVFFIAAILFPNEIIRFFIKNEEIVLIGTQYLRIACLSYLPMVLSLATSSAMRAMGNTKTPLFISMFSVFTNVVLDYVLIFGEFGFPALGVEGAAIATVMARVLEMTLYMLALKKMDMPFKTRVTDLFHFTFDLAKNITKKAVPLCTNEILWSSGMATLMKLYSTRGVIANTAYSMTTTIADLFFVLFAGMATASTVMIGTSLGANRIDEARDNGYKLIVFSMLLSLVFAAVMFGSSFLVPSLYNVSKEASDLASNFLRVESCLFWLYMFNTQCYFTLRAGGDTKSTMFMDSGFMWTFNLPLVTLLAYATDISIILLFVAGQCTDFVKAIISYKLVKKEKWLTNLTQ